jgi:hypothetical protein
MTHSIFGFFAIEIKLKNLLMDIILSWWSDKRNSTLAFWRHQNAMLREKTILIDLPKDIALA